jgi:hypothetical protein
METEYPFASKERQQLENLIEKLRTQEFADFFGLSLDEITDFLRSINFSVGRGVSPMFLSPGYGENQTYNPMIKMTILSDRVDTYLHEARHGLHLKVCSVIFERPEMNLEAFRLFCENILGDERFVRYIIKSGSPLQKKFLHDATVLKNKENLTPADISEQSVWLGALTYQHAYFVDPCMCEAVASYKDEGITRIIGSVNRALATPIPYKILSLKGYGDKKCQGLFEQAGLIKKALLIRSLDYRREEFFNSK